jgi:hypothetical protein
MPARKQQPNAARARLDVLAASDDEATFLRVALETLASAKRLDREAALEALANRPLPGARDAASKLYLELDQDGLKRDQGCGMRGNIVLILTAIADSRDTPIAVRASETSEKVFGDDVAYGLRMRGLQMLARIAPDVFPYYAIERLDDATPYDDEPAATAIRLLAATGNHAALYGWLRGPGMESPNLIRAFDALSDAPPEIVRRFVDGAVETAIRRQDETLCTVLAEAIVNLEMDGAYPAIGGIMSGKVTDELYTYLAMLLAATNRDSLLAILEQQLNHGRRPKLILQALNVRPTDEQRAIVARWESR